MVTFWLIYHIGFGSLTNQWGIAPVHIDFISIINIRDVDQRPKHVVQNVWLIQTRIPESQTGVHQTSSDFFFNVRSFKLRTELSHQVGMIEALFQIVLSDASLAPVIYVHLLCEEVELLCKLFTWP